MLAKITHRIRAQWERDFTELDALACILLCLPVGTSLIILGTSVNF